MTHRCLQRGVLALAWRWGWRWRLRKARPTPLNVQGPVRHGQPGRLVQDLALPCTSQNIWGLGFLVYEEAVGG